jgi:hypothetical protein
VRSHSPPPPPQLSLQVAAYAYDDWAKPFENEGTLLKQFTLTVRVGAAARVSLATFGAKSVYALEVGGGVESLEIEHRSCNNFENGYFLSLYFGGRMGGGEGGLMRQGFALRRLRWLWTLRTLFKLLLARCGLVQ